MNQRTAIDSPASDGERSAAWVRIVAALPWNVLYAIASVLAFVARHVVRFKVSIVRDNLKRCFPQRSKSEINALVSAFYRQLAQVAVEFLKMAGMSADEISAHLTPIDFDQVRAQLDTGRSVILLAAHQCNWEWNLQGTTMQLEVQVDAAYKPLHAAAPDRELRKLRVRFGAHLIAAKRLVREVVQRRRQVQVHAVALIADQMPTSSQRRHWLTFLGRDTAFYPGPGEIARMTGYAAFFVGMRRTRRGQYELKVQPISGAEERLEPREFTARYAALVEAQVRAQPADWMWLHRRWKSAPPELTSAGVEGAQESDR
jgi:KDO2-lipid IV(A) lauroyltransferase